MSATLADAEAAEKESIATYDGLISAKTKEVVVLTSTIESKTQQIGELGVNIVTMKQDLSDTQDALAEDRQFLAELEKGCSTKSAEWEERSKTRSAELVALADTIKVLNDDDALELFKKSLPSPGASLIEVRGGVSARREHAMEALRSAQSKASHQDKPGLELLVLALAGKKSVGTGGFDKVVKMIDDMVGILKQEQDDDEHKKEYCAAQSDNSDDDKKALERKIAGEESAIASAKEALATLTQEIAALEAGIRALDQSVADATAQRKEENADYKAW